VKKIYIKIFLWSSCLLILLSDNLQSKAKFSSKSSQLRVAGNSQFNVSSPTTSIKNGGISVDSTAKIKGQLIAFNGILDQGAGGAQLQVNGKYNPTLGANGTIYLENNNQVSALNPGLVRSDIIVTGQNNLLQGNMQFAGSITLANPTTQLTLDLVAPLNTTIKTPANGGRIDLKSDITFADNVALPSGSDTTPTDIAFNGNRANMGGKMAPAKGATRFIKGADLVLNGKVELDGATWIFSEDAVLNANGNLIDLKNGGTFFLEPNTNVQMTNLILRNIEQDSMLFSDATSGMELSSVVFEVANTVTTTVGSISVVGQSTIIIKDGTWTFTESAQLQVDGVSALIDTSVNPNPNALVAETVFTNNGAIHYLFLDSIIYLFSGINTSTFLTITSSFIVSQEKTMVFGATTTIDAFGGSIIFTAPPFPQFVLLPNTTVYLQNIILENINKNTFSIDPTATLILGKGTELHLSTDLTFSQGTILLDNPGGSVVIQGNLFNTLEIQDNRATGPTLDLGTTTLILENIYLKGLEHIEYQRDIIDGKLIVGTISLSGNTLVDIDKDLDMYFLIEKLNNYIRLKKTDLHLSGGLNFQDTGENQLVLSFLDSIVSSGTPRVFFADNYFYLASQDGRAYVSFNNYNMEVFNEGSNSFVMDIGGFLSGKNLIVNNFPVKLLSNLIDIDLNMNILSDQPNALDAAFIRKQRLQAVEHNGLHPLLRDMNMDVTDIEQPVLFTANDEHNQINAHTLSSVRAIKPARKQKAIVVPTNPTTYINAVQLSSAEGEIVLQGANARIQKFGISSTAPLNVTLQDGASLDLKLLANADDYILLKEQDVINIVGTGNVIRVNSDFVIQGSILFDQGSDLRIEFENDSILFLENDLTLEPGIQCSCQGDGRFEIGDEISLILKKSDTFYPTEMAFENNAVLSLAEGAIGYIEGIGRISCKNAGGIRLDVPGTLCIGTEVTDAIDLFVDQAEVIIGFDGESDQAARLSCAYGSYSFENHSHGVLFVGKNGVFECNVRDGVYVGGTFDSTTIKFGGLIFLDTEGKIILGENNMTRQTKKAKTISVDTISSDIQGDGILVYMKKAPAVPFEARMGAVPKSLKIRKADMEVQDFFYRFAQQSDKLKTALLYLTPAGQYILRMKSGALISLFEDDEVIREDDKGNVFISNNLNEDDRMYDKNGKLI
jgi:hypothetical protein